MSSGPEHQEEGQLPLKREDQQRERLKQETLGSDRDQGAKLRKGLRNVQDGGCVCDKRDGQQEKN